MASASEITYELPTEIWEQIFSYLSVYQLLKVRSTCRRWKTTVDHKQSLAERLMFIFRCSKPESLDHEYQPEIPDVLIRAADLSRVNIIDIDTWWPSLGSRLTTLSLCDCKVSLSRLVEMFRHTPKLANLTMNSLEYTSLECAEPDFRLDQLEILTIDEESMFEALIPICLRLKWLSLERRYFSNENNDLVCCKLIKNVRLTLEKLDFELTEYGHQYLFERNEVPNTTDAFFPNLKKLDLCISGEVPDSDDISLATYLTTMPQLEELDLSAPHFVQLDGLNATKLKKLSLFDIFPFDLESLVIGAPNLRELVLEAGGLPWWGDVFDVVDKIPTLRSLKVSSPEPLNYAPCLANARPNNLEVLYLYDCIRFDAKLLNKFLKLSSQLKKLELHKMDIDDEAIETIVSHLRRLEQLVLEIPGGLRKDLAKLVVNNCLLLNKFKIINNKKFYTEVKQHVAEHGRNVAVEYFDDLDF